MEKKKYRAKVTRISHITKDILALTITKPNNYNFLAGQYTVLTIPAKEKETKNENFSRYFSIANSPNENELYFVLRTGESEYKKSLKNIPTNSHVLIDKAAGKIILPNNNKDPIVLLAGGIGITPFRSIILDLLSKNPSYPIYLFSSNKKEEEAIFDKEFRTISKKMSNLYYHLTLTQTAPHTRITSSLIKKYVSEYKNAKYFIVGSHRFIQGMNNCLEELSVNKSSRYIEVFCGYCPDHECCCSFV